MEDLISVIVPVYLVEEYLDQCVQSIVGQTYKNLEIILVDDGSPDACPAMCDRWAEKDARIRVIHKKNGGLSDARNAGLAVCTGEWIAFADSDDWIEPPMYAELLDAAKKEQADISACNIVSCYPDRRVSWGAGQYTVGDPETILNMLYSDTQFPVCAWNKLYRRELWEDFRFPAGKICEDAFTTYQLVHRASRIVQLDRALYCYRIRPESIMTAAFDSRNMDEEEAWRNNCDFVRAHYPALYRKAFTFYLQKVNNLIHRISPEQKPLYEKEYAALRTILSDNLPFLLFKSTATLKYRIRFLLDYQKL